MHNMHMHVYTCMHTCTYGLYGMYAAAGDAGRVHVHVHVVHAYVVLARLHLHNYYK